MHINIIRAKAKTLGLKTLYVKRSKDSHHRVHREHRGGQNLYVLVFSVFPL